MTTTSRSSGSTPRRFIRARDGNVSIMLAISAVPVLFALGAVTDYGFAVKTRARMNAAADAAALAAVTPYEMSQKTQTAKTAAQNMFISQVSSLPRLVFDGSKNADLKVTVKENTVNQQRVRTATVTYSASSVTAFSSLLKMSTIAIGGSSTATASTSPNIDFYLMIDTSPSMAIPATTSGINWMVANTPAQGGCAFACHQYNPAADNLGNPGGIDNYQLAKNQSPPIILRMDLVTQAVSDLMTTASTTASSSGATYRLAGYTFDVSVNNPIAMQVPPSDPNTANSLASNIKMLEVYSNNYLTVGVGNNDEDTNFDSAFTTINQAMTAAGAGTGSNGDKPQQVLMLVTDGVADENWNSARTYLPLGGTTNLSAQSTDWCTNIKANANVRIAVLYLTYNPLPSNSWYTTYIAPQQSDIAPTLQNCASPGLFFQVNTNGDISSAMTTLFQSAVKSSARLSN